MENIIKNFLLISIHYVELIKYDIKIRIMK